jgi:hypothetical protein
MAPMRNYQLDGLVERKSQDYLILDYVPIVITEECFATFYMKIDPLNLGGVFS